MALSAAAAGLAGAGTGAATGLLYRALDLSTATTVHMGLILGGGAVGALVLGRLMESKVERPVSYALGALAGAGFIWGTSALGLLANPVTGAVAGGLVGAFYGGVAGMVLSR